MANLRQSVQQAGSAPATMKQCALEWSQDKANGSANGQTWPQYLATCRAKHESAATANTNIGPAWLPWNRPATPNAPVAPAPTNQGQATTPAPTTSANEQAVRNHCPSDTVVWVNTKSHIYHFAGTAFYGKTENGTFMCEAEAKNSGGRAALNEKHP